VSVRDIVLGLDLGGTQLKGAVVDESGVIVESARVKTPLELEALRKGLGELIGRLGSGARVRGVGVASKGVIEPFTTRVECLPGVMSYMEGCVYSEVVREAVGADIPVFADNDARVALVGECVWGAARGKRDAIMLTLGTGVGGGILSDGRIIRGHRGIAGHLGHINVDPEGPPCICGNRGCLESVFSARVIESEAYGALHRGLISTLRSDEPPTCAGVFSAAAAGDELAMDIVRRGISKLGAAIAGLLHALDSEVVILGGQVAGAGETLFAPLREDVRSRTRFLLRREVPIVPMQVADQSGVVGAAALVFSAEERVQVAEP
jgi:glucokinase